MPADSNKYQFDRVVRGATYKEKMPDEFKGSRSKAVNMYVTINHDEQGKPLEIFVRYDVPEYFEMITNVTRLASMALRDGTPLKEIADDLVNTYSPTTNHIPQGKREVVPSITARIGMVLRKYIETYKPQEAA